VCSSGLRGGGLCRIPPGASPQRDLLEDQGEQERHGQQRDQVRVEGREGVGECQGDDVPERGRQLMVGSAVATIVWSSAASSMPSIRAEKISRT
jgi:hypothetical protein